MVMKFNPKTNRFENVGPAPAGATPTTTVPKSTATTTPRSTPSTTVPASPSASSEVTLTPAEQALIDAVSSGIITDPNIVKDYTDYSNIGAKTSKSGGSNTAQANADAKIRVAQIQAKLQKEAARKAADILKRSGLETQTAYNTLAESQFKDITGRADKYYGGQKETALKNIDAATADFLSNLIAPTAYASAPVASLSPEQQGLMANLKSYGATGGQAAEQMASDAASNQFLADLMRTSNKQLQTADVDYFNALKNAASGGKMAARQGLEGIISGLRGQDQSTAEAIRRELLSKGIEALLSNNQNAANLIAGSQ